MTPVRPLTRPLVGRESDLAALRTVLDEVRTGQPQLVVVEGPAGIGKTALLDGFVGGQPDVRVLRSTGEQWEAFVSFGVGTISITTRFSGTRYFLTMA